MGKNWVKVNFQVIANSCQSVLGALELKSMGLILDMGSGTINSSKKCCDLDTALPEPLVEQHVIQNCAISSLDSALSAMLLREVDNPELESLIWKFSDLFTEGVGIYTGDSHRIRFKPDAIPT